MSARIPVPAALPFLRPHDAVDGQRPDGVGQGLPGVGAHVMGERVGQSQFFGYHMWPFYRFKVQKNMINQVSKHLH